MKSKFLIAAVFLAIAFLFKPGQALAYAGGDGTWDYPYQIATCDDLWTIGTSDNYQAYFALVNDLSCPSTNYPINANGYDFSGQLDGRFHTISNLNIVTAGGSAPFVGLFRTVANATIKNLTISSSSFDGLQYVGALAGIAANVHLENVAVVSSTVNSANYGSNSGYAGGLFGRLQSTDPNSSSTLTNVYSKSNVTASVVAGGLIGYMDIEGVSTTLSQVYASGRISGLFAGGLIGMTYGDDLSRGLVINNSFASTTLVGANQGGLIASLVSTPLLAPVIKTANSYYNANGSSSLACLASVNPSGCTAINIDGSQASYFNNSSTTPPFKAGGSQLWDFSTVWQTTAALPSLRVQAIPALPAPTVAGPVLDLSASNGEGDISIALNWGGVYSTGGLSLSQYLIRWRKQNTGTWTGSKTVAYDRWNHYAFINDLTEVYEFQIAAVNASGTGPYSASVTAGPVYNINSCSDLQSMKYDHSAAAHYRIVNADGLNCTGFDYTSVYDFKGEFDGNNKTISNLTVNNYNDNAGIFDTINGTANVHDFTIANSHISDSADSSYVENVGAVAGQMTGGTISNVRVLSNNVINAGYDASGGLVGRIHATDNPVTISNCSSSPSFSFNNVLDEYEGEGSSQNIGGLIGIIESSSFDVEVTSSASHSNIINDGNIVNVGGLIGSAVNYGNSDILISNSEATGNISGDYRIGGLIGQAVVADYFEADATIKIQNSHAFGDVTNSDYDYNYYSGGLVGSASVYAYTENQALISIDDSYATGAVSGNYGVGGLLGGIDDNDSDGISLDGGATGGLAISRSAATGDVSGGIGSIYLGGLGGYLSCDGTCTISNDYATGNVTGGTSLGGLIGMMVGYGSEVSNTYATGNVHSLVVDLASTPDDALYVGGLAGAYLGFLSSSFSTGEVITEIASDSTANGFIGAAMAGLDNNFFDSHKAGRTLCYPDWVSGENDSNCKDIPGGVASGYFKGVGDNQPFKVGESQLWDTAVWRFSAGSYPSLRAFSLTGQYSLNYSASSGGTISGSASQSVNSGSSGTAVTAVANTGYRFVSWSDGSTANPRTDTNITGDLTLTASFEAIPSSGGGSAMISLPPGIGSGAIDSSAGGLGSTINAGMITQSGTNILTYITNVNNFQAPESSNSWNFGNHDFVITNLDLANYIATIVFHSSPITITLKKGESKDVDLDGDKIADVRATFVNTYVNRAEITVKSLSKAAITSAKPATAAQTAAKFVFKKNLSVGTISNDVKELQKYLNANGYLVAKTGAGSPGKETTKFGAGTRTALIKFQKAKGIKPANGSFGATTRGVVNK